MNTFLTLSTSPDREANAKTCVIIGATLFDLYSRIKVAHWNFTGMSFIGIHDMLGSLAGDIEGYVDDYMERSVALGYAAMMTIREAIPMSRLGGAMNETKSPENYVKSVAADLSACTAILREASTQTDQATSNMILDHLESMEKWLWKVEAHVR